MKRENLNLLIMVILILIPLISMVFISNITMNAMEKDNTSLTETIENADNEGTAVIGTLLYLPFAGLFVLGSIIIFLIIGVLIVITFISMLMAILARAIIKNKKKKVAYRVLMTFVYIPYVVLEFILLSLMFTHFSFILLIYNAVFLIGLGINFYNTYSSKMYAIENDENMENKQVEEEKKEEIKE